MLIRTTLVAGICVAGLLPASVLAQRVERLEYFEAGDRVTYNYTLNNKVQQIQELWTSVTNDEILGVLKIGDKEIPVVMTKSPLLQKKGMCIASGQACTFQPAGKFIDLPLEKGKRWTTTTTVEGETFVVEVTQDYSVDKFEKVRVPAGEFDAFKIINTGRYKGTDKQGKPISGKYDHVYWVAFAAGKPLWVKSTYRNYDGTQTARELVSTTLK
jgi:hypothetical protein